MTSLLTRHPANDWTEHRNYQLSPTRSRSIFNFHNASSKDSPKSNPPSPDGTEEDTTDDKTSDEEPDVRNQNGVEDRGKPRSGSIISFSNVKRKISTTFHRRNSTAGVAVTSPVVQRKHTRRASVSNLPSLQRQIAIDEGQTHKRTSSLRLRKTTSTSANTAAGTAASSSPKPPHISAHPLLDRLRNNIREMDPFATSSTPDIQSRSRASSTQAIKKFNVYLLGSHAVGKTALTVRFLTGRYIGEYTSSAEEVYNRVVKYGDEQVDVTIYANDIESMEDDICLDENSGLMILYSIVDKASYEKAKILLEYLRDLSITGVYPVVLIGTKRDLSRARKIRRQKVFETANSFNCTQFDVSAATDRRVKDCFHTLFRQIEIRQLLQHGNKQGTRTILNPPKIFRHGTYRYGTL